MARTDITVGMGWKEMTGIAAPQSVWEKTTFGTIASLIAAGVTGLWMMSVNMGRIEEKIASWTSIYEKRFDGMEKRLERFEAEQNRFREDLWRDKSRINGRS